MLQKKICMLGAFSVGKTTLVKRYVESVFSERYITTVGVKIDKKVVSLPERTVNLILWDMAGEDDAATIRMSYLRGMAGCMVVADGTRAITLDIALSIRERVESEHGALPFVMLLNKHDLLDQWVTPDSTLEALRARGWSVRLSSARSGEGVDEAFTELAERVTR